MTGAREHIHSFPCFGGECTVIVADAEHDAQAATAALEARAALLTWHRRFSRFRADSEISFLNRAPYRVVRVSPLMARIVRAGLDAARETGGLVDVTLAAEVVRAGYSDHLEPDCRQTTGEALDGAPARRPAAPRSRSCLDQVTVDVDAATITRPPGLAIDVGGIAKGVFADELARMLDGFDAYAVDCAGDLRVGGRARLPRVVQVAAPDGGVPLHAFTLRAGAAATSGILRRAWRLPDGRPAHHLLDPGSGLPAFTGLIQATALAPTAARAEAIAKAALLSGPKRAASWLAHGGVLVREDGRSVLVREDGRSEPVCRDGRSEPVCQDGHYASARAGIRAEIQPSRSSSTSSRSGSFRISWNSPS